LIRVVANSSLRGVAPSPDLVRELIGGLQRQPAVVTITDIQTAVADSFGVPARSLLDQDRRPPIVMARQVAMYLARELTDESLPAIGQAFGGRNHSTVLNAVRRIARAIEDDPPIAATVDNLQQALTHRA
jgi:chromosomal replication initiator protein